MRRTYQSSTGQQIAVCLDYEFPLYRTETEVAGKKVSELGFTEEHACDVLLRKLKQSFPHLFPLRRIA